MKVAPISKCPWEVISDRPSEVSRVRENEVEVSRSQDTSQLSLLAQLKPAWLAMKVFGLLPISAQPAAASSTRSGLSAAQVAYAAGFYLVFTALIVQKAIAIKAVYFGGTYISHVRLIFALMYAELLVPHLLIGPLHWSKMDQLLGFFKDWDAFETRFLTVTRHPLRLDMSRLSTLVVTSVVVGSLALCYWFSWLVILPGDYVGTALFMYSITQINFLLAVWTLLCYATAKAADLLAMRLQKEFLKVGAVGVHVVHGYHRVWLRLSKLTRDIGTMFSSVFNVIVLFWLTQMLLTAFQGTVLLVNDCVISTLLVVVIFAVTDLLSIMVFCHAASCAADSVGDNFRNILVMIEVDATDIQKQLHALELAVGTHAPVISLGGFYDVNRSLIVSIMAAFSTYLVVLLQSTPTSEIDPCGNGVGDVNTTTHMNS